MDVQIYVDLVRYAHILVVAVGFGGAFLTDMHALSRLSSPIDQGFLSMMRFYHATIWYSLIAMWITGLVMIYIRTGFELANFTPKLFAKLTVVSILTLNAKIIHKVVMPLIAENIGKNLMWMPLDIKIWLAVIGAVSTSSWMLALAMGSSKVLAASGWMTFVLCVPIAYVAAIGAAVAALSLLHAGASMAPVRASTVTLKIVETETGTPTIIGRRG